MKKLLIGIGSLVIIILAVVTVGGFVLLQTIDLEKVKSEVIAAVKEKTGRDLTLGKLDIAVSFSPAISVREASLSNPSWAKSPYLAKVKEASVSFDVLPLLSKQLKINSIAIDGLETSLESSKTGEKSWDMQMDSGETKQAKAEASSNFSVAFEGIDGKDIGINYLDQATGKKESVRLSKIQLKGDPKLSLTAHAERGDGQYEMTATGESVDAVLSGAPVEIAFHAKSGKSDAEIALKGTARDVTLTPSFDGTISAKAASLSDFGAFSGSSLPASEPLSLQSAVKATPARIVLSEMNAAVGDKKGTGSLSADLSKKIPYVKGSFNLPSLTLGNAPGGDEEGGKEAAAGKGGKAIPNIALPTEGLDKAEADVKVAIGTLSLPAQTLQNVDATIALHGGKLSVAPFSFALNGAPVSGNLALSANGVSMEANGKGIPVDALAKDAPVKGGAATFSMKIAGSGKDLHGVLSTLSGQTSFYMKDVTYQLKQQGTAALLKTLNGGGSGDVVLSCAAGTFNINQGIASTDAIVADTNAVRMDGNGSVNLAQEQWKMLLIPTPKTPGLSELAVPLRVSGSFTSPTVLPDPAGTAMAAAKVGLGFAAASSPAGIVGGLLFNQLTPSAGDEAMKNSPCFSAPPQSAGTTQAPATLKGVVKEKEDQIRNLRDNVKGLKDLKLF